METETYELVTTYKTNKEDPQAVIPSALIHSAVGGSISEKDVPIELRFNPLDPSEDIAKLISERGW